MAHVIEREALSKSVGRGSPDRIPAVLLARLALDRSMQGQRYGSVLLADALAKVVEASELVAARFVQHGFVQTPVAGRMARKISDVAAELRARG